MNKQETVLKMMIAAVVLVMIWPVMASGNKLVVAMLAVLCILLVLDGLQTRRNRKKARKP